MCFVRSLVNSLSLSPTTATVVAARKASAAAKLAVGGWGVGGSVATIRGRVRTIGPRLEVACFERAP